MKRNTSQKAAIKKVFELYDRPLGVDEVLDYGREIVEKLNLATVYRNLKILTDDGWLIRLTHPSVGVLYEKAGKGHHHHFHCRECNHAYDLPGCPLNQQALTPEGFIVEDHEVLLFGLCPSCNGSI